MKRGLLLVAGIFCWISVSGEDSLRYTKRIAGTPFLRVQYYQGVMWSRTQYLESQFADGNRGVDLRMGFQTSGNQSWHRSFHYPSYGFGIHHADLVMDPSDTIVGDPWSLFFFYRTAWWDFWRITLGSDQALGLSYTDRIHDPVLNPYNDVIASRVNLFFDLHIYLEMNLTKRLSIASGYGVTHYSNGGIHQPQKGVNVWGWVFGLNYWFSDPVPSRRHLTDPVTGDAGSRNTPEFSPSESLQLMVSAGTVELHKLGEPEGSRYFTSSLTADYAIRNWYKSAVTLGMDFMYDGSLARAIKGLEPEQVSFFQKTYLGGHIGYQRVIDRFTLFFNLGTYFLQHSYDRGFLFSRLGGRVRIVDQLHLHMAIKTKNGVRSDWIEWGVAYHLQTR